jgi:hypothetical protein
MVVLLCLLFISVLSFAQQHPQVQDNGELTYADSINNGLIPTDTLKKSVHRVAMQTIGGCHLHIEYSSPGVRGRKIWGELVPYDKVWVTGAHSATAITITKAIRMGGTTIPAGKYALFTIPGTGSWTVIINKNPNQHQADNYKQSEDVVRLTVQPVSHATTQRLTYEIRQKKENKGEILINWEQLSVAVPFDVK